ncbi:hypothetical protein F4780DRAFT_785540 [Xylariomycetidae sp. FL0641]|nr:hypothetical protein F4780DRAFT_785540 [Xylariomycetidae sp. FL0641]
MSFSEFAMNVFYQEDEELQLAVETLCRDLWPGLTHSDISVKSMPEGSNHKIFQVSVRSDGQVQDHILRVPSSPKTVANNVACLKFVGECTKLPVPRLTGHDLTENNALGCPWMMTTKIPGISMEQALKDGITQEQRLAIAKDLGRLYSEIFSVTNDHAGEILAVDSDSSSSGALGRVQPLGLSPNNPDFEFSLNKDSPFPLLTCEDAKVPSSEVLLVAMGESHKRHRDDIVLGDRLQETCDIYDEMDEMGLFPDDGICLAHPDLYPRNIMVDLEGTARVTGILDWDETAFLPRFLANKPPAWLWIPMVFEDSNQRDDSLAVMKEDLESFGGVTSTPDTPEMMEVKKAFEDNVGEAYMAKPFSPEAYLALQLLTFTSDSAFSCFVLDYHLRVWDVLRNKWSELRKAHLSGEDEAPDSKDDLKSETGESKAPTASPTAEDAAETTAETDIEVSPPIVHTVVRTEYRLSTVFRVASTVVTELLIPVMVLMLGLSLLNWLIYGADAALVGESRDVLVWHLDEEASLKLLREETELGRVLMISQGVLPAYIERV